MALSFGILANDWAIFDPRKSPNQAPLGYEEKRVGEIIDQLPKNVGLKYNDLSNYIKTNKPTLVNSTVDFRYFHNKHLLNMAKYCQV